MELIKLKKNLHETSLDISIQLNLTTNKKYSDEGFFPPNMCVNDVKLEENENCLHSFHAF